MPRWSWAAIIIVVILRQQINIGKYKAVKVIQFQRFFESSIE